MSDYVIAAVGSGWNVAKFSGDAEPEAVYHVSENQKGWKCDCPAFVYQRKGKCKHITMVQEKLTKESES